MHGGLYIDQVLDIKERSSGVKGLDNAENPVVSPADDE